MPTNDLTSRHRIFRGHVRRALLHLYDPASLRRSPLLDLLGLANPTDRVFATRELIQKAIQALKPERSQGLRPTARQIYQVLNYRFLEQMAQKEVAAELAISLRQLQRLEAMALDTLSAYLLEAYHIRLEDLKMAGTVEEDSADIIRADIIRAGDTRADTITAEDDQAELDLEEAEREAEAAQPAHLRQELEWIRASGSTETVGLRAFLEQVLDTTAPLLAAREIDIQADLPAAAVQVTGNLMALRQGLINILTALAGALPPGPLHLLAEASGDPLSVRIQRPGSDPSALLTGAEERVQLASELFQIAGGQLELQPGGIRIWLPSARPLVVLAVDDNADALALVSGYLSGTGCQVHSLRDPQQVLAAVQSIRPDVILLDVMMPGVDGWQILGRLKHNPQSAQIPVIISTILPQAELAYSLGADAFLRKPFSRQELAGLVSQLTQTALKLP